MLGVVVQWYCKVALHAWYLLIIGSTLASLGFFSLSLSEKFRFRYIAGIFVYISFFALGAMRVWHQDTRHAAEWFGSYVSKNALVVAVLNETPVEKPNSFKANATVSCLVTGKHQVSATGTVILYFRKDPLMPSPGYGTRICFSKPLQEIKNPGNPGSFDYTRYALFQGITHQVFLSPREYVILDKPGEKWLPALLGSIRRWVLDVLRKYITGERERGLAEALLIGYKNDLDKGLVQSYANTGVVHIIAISGLHLGLIYWLLVGMLRPLRSKKAGIWLCPLFIISGLWLFTLLAGAQPSICRSAVMFTCIVLGQNIGRKTSIYNTLAFSAFVLLCYNPFWLWDLGFQLSYSAVLSLVIFMQPVYNLLFINNKLADLLWKMNAVTIAAQVLTVPLCIYHFHQLPTLFLFTNLLAVPLSSIILLGEILLCAISQVPAIAVLVGKTITALLRTMNDYILSFDAIKFSVWDGLQVTVVQVMLLFIFIAGISRWLMYKSKKACIAGLISISVFLGIRAFSFWQASRQQSIIVYNISRHQAIDFVDGRRCYFRGDRDVLTDDFMANFHLKPSRTLYRILHNDTTRLSAPARFISFHGIKVLIADTGLAFQPPARRGAVDLVIFSKNPRIDLPALYQIFDIRKIIFDASVPAGKAVKWKIECDSLRIPYHDVSEKGAFVMTLI